jgi:hypothetical protein
MHIAADPLSLLHQLGPGSGMAAGGDVHAGLGGAAILDFAVLKKARQHG